MMPPPYHLQLPVLHSSEVVSHKTTRSHPSNCIHPTPCSPASSGQPAPPDSGLVCSSDEPIPVGIPRKEMPGLPSFMKMAAVLSKSPACLKKREKPTTSTASQQDSWTSWSLNQVWKLLQMGVKPATGGVILQSKRLSPTKYQRRELFISGAEETKNRGQTLQFLEAVWASSVLLPGSHKEPRSRP